MKTNLTKIKFKEFIDKSGRQTDFLSEWQLDNRYLEFKLFALLDNHRDECDFSALGLPDELEAYDICAKTPVTLNAELYRFYACGYFFFHDDFVNHVKMILKLYTTGAMKVKNIVAELRAERLKFMNDL